MLKRLSLYRWFPRLAWASDPFLTSPLNYRSYYDFPASCLAPRPTMPSSFFVMAQRERQLPCGSQSALSIDKRSRSAQGAQLFSEKHVASRPTNFARIPQPSDLTGWPAGGRHGYRVNTCRRTRPRHQLRSSRSANLIQPRSSRSVHLILCQN